MSVTSGSPPPPPPKPPRNRGALRVVDPMAPPPKGVPLESQPLAWWFSCTLRTTLSEPRVHELELPKYPDGRPGERVVLTVDQMFSPSKLRNAIYDAAGRKAPFPQDKNKRVDFLEEVWERLFLRRIPIHVGDEASDLGHLKADIETRLRQAPVGDEMIELESGAVIPHRTRAGYRYFSGPVLLDRVKRTSPVKFTVSQFYNILEALGCHSVGSSRVSGGNRRRLRLAPPELFADEPEADSEAATGIHETVPSDSSSPSPSASTPAVSGTFKSAPPAAPEEPAQVAFEVGPDDHDAWEPPPEPDESPQE